MRRVLSVVMASLVLGGAATISQSAPPSQAPQALSPEARWQRAVDAWEAGQYPAALDDLRTLMKSPAATEYFDRVALLTGELFVTTVLTTDGRNPRISADGAFASYETGPTNAPVTRIVRMGPTPQPVAELQTSVVAFDRSGRRLAWIRTRQGADAASSELVVRDLSSGAETVWLGAGLQKADLAWAANDQGVIFVGTQPGATDRTDAYLVRAGQAPEVLTTETGRKGQLLLDTAGRTLVYRELPPAAAGGAGRGGAGGGRGGGAGAPVVFGVVSLADKSTRKIAGTGLTVSADGSRIAWLSREGDITSLNAADNVTGRPTVVRSGRERIDALALSPDGSQVAYQLMTHTDWEIYISSLDSPTPAHRRVTRDIQHDLLPRFLGPTQLLVMKGEARHRRSHLYDLTAGTNVRLFANNTIRTISPEYAWVPSANGRALILQAERDGDTVSVERDISVIDLSRKITPADLLARLDRQAAAENDLRTRMTAAYKPVDAAVRRALARGAVNRVFAYEKALYDFDSKHITQPGNMKAIEYLERTYRSFGYAPEIQWFTPPALQASGGRTGNVVATLKGTEHPELVYVVSSHFDSVAVGPGADDDTSGTAALLETARMLSGTPLPATVVFASLTGEEAGLLGSREFVRLAAANKWRIVGALNNDMIGWAADSAQLNNTIRYSNAGIRDIQHGAAFLYTNLVLFDAKYYKSTDAAAFYDGWGDIVGGLGSYPVLANPNYHQPTDFLETMSHQQILETARVTAATLIHLASSPSRLVDLKAERTGAGVEVTWTPSAEKGVTSYTVAYGPEADPLRTRVTVTGPKAALPALPAGTHIAVRARNARGLDGWDWARTIVQ